IPLLVKLHTALGTKATVPVCQIKFVVSITHDLWCHRLLFTLSSVDDIYPLQYFTQVMTMHPGVTDDASSQCARNARAELQTTPTLSTQFVEETRPTYACTCCQECTAIPFILNGISVEGDASNNTTHTCICVKHVCS